MHEGVELHEVSYSIAPYTDGRELIPNRVQPARAGGRHKSLAAGVPAPLTSAWESSCARRSDDTEARNDILGCFGRSDRRALDGPSSQ
jgi:hypothetical protein